MSFKGQKLNQGIDLPHFYPYQTMGKIVSKEKHKFVNFYRDIYLLLHNQH